MNLLGLVDIPTWILIVLGLFIAAYKYGTRTFDAFDGYDLPGPKPYPFIGNILKSFTMGFLDFDVYMMKTYGKTIKLFAGSRVGLMTMDEDIMRAVCVKEFNHFVDRPTVDTGDEISELMLSSARGLTWRRLRHLLSPTFSSGKLKNMNLQVIRCAQILCDNLKENAGKSFEIKPVLQSFTMDIIAATAFGLELNALKDPDNPFVKMGKKAFDFNLFNPLVLIAVVAPKMLPILFKFGFKFLPADVEEFFTKITDQAIDSKLRGESTQMDFLQLMLNAHEHKADENDVTDSAIGSVDDPSLKMDKALSRKELLSQSLLFFLAGFETTAATASFTFYNLAVYPEKQEKLYEEIRKVLGDKASPDYKDLQEMKYLEHCINETLRLYPPGFRIARTATSDVTIKGITIKKGWDVSFPIYVLHRDPDIWEDPDEFKPERFEESRNLDYKFMPFGMGPRNCIGMRLALMEVKAAVAVLINSCKLVRTEETLYPLEFDKRKFFQPVKPIKIGIELRN